MRTEPGSQKQTAEICMAGNVRELQHTIERAVILGDSSMLKPENFLFSHHVQTEKKRGRSDTESRTTRTTGH